MSRMDLRLSEFETAMLPEPFKPALTFLWGSDEDNAALAALECQAEAEDRHLIIIRLVAPTAPELSAGVLR